MLGDDGSVDFPEGSFLGAVGPDDLDALVSSGRMVRRAPGEALCLEGDPSSAVWFVVEGHVKLSKVALSGREVVLELRGPGEVVGEMGVIDGGPRSASVITLGPTELVALTPAEFFDVVDRRPAISRRLLRHLVGRLRQAADRQLELGTADVVVRLAQRLVELAGSLGVDQTVDLDAVAGDEATAGVLIAEGISQQDLADWCGTSRDSVVRALRHLRTAGLVDSGRSRVLIRDLPALRALAASA